MASIKTTPRKSAAVPAPDVAPFIDLDCHVLPLLDAIEWMGHASHKLTEIEGVMSVHPGVKCFDGISGPERPNAGGLVSGLAWVAASLLRRYQEEQYSEQAGGAA